MCRMLPLISSIFLCLTGCTKQAECLMPDNRLMPDNHANYFCVNIPSSSEPFISSFTEVPDTRKIVKWAVVV